MQIRRLVFSLALLALCDPLLAQAPVANADSAGTCQGVPVVVNVLANDSAAAGLQCAQTLAWGVVPAGAGTVAIISDPACINGLCNQTCVRFTPAGAFVGNASFRYTIRDTNNVQATAQVAVVVGNPPTSCGPNSATRTVVAQDCFGCPIGSTNANWSSPLGTAPRLRIAKAVLGIGETLRQVDLQLTGTTSGQVRVENQDPFNGCLPTVNMNFAGQEFLPAAVPQFCAPGLGFSASFGDSSHFLAPFDGTLDFGGPSGFTLNLAPTFTTVTRTLSQPDGLAAFIDSNPSDGIPEYVELDHVITSTTSIAPCSAIASQLSPFGAIDAAATYSICIVATSPVIARDDSAATCMNSPVNINVLLNDSSSAGLQCSAMSVAQPVPAGAGTTAIVTDPACTNFLCNQTCVRFTPAPGFQGRATFQYSIRDNFQLTSVANVTVVVGDAPLTCTSGGSTRTVVVEDCYPPCPLDGVAQWVSNGTSVPHLRAQKALLAPGESLLGVHLRVTWMTRGTLAVENRDPLNSCIESVSLSSTVSVTSPATCSPTPFVIPTSYNNLVPLAPFDGSVDFAGPSGATLSVPQLSTSQSLTLSQPAAVAAFIDSNPTDGIPEFVQLPHSATSNSSFTPCAPITFFTDPFGSVRLTTTYTICGPSGPFCAGDGLDPNVSTPCPCANFGAPGRGCAHSQSAAGAELALAGTPSLDTAVLAASGMPPTSTAIYLMGDALFTSVFGDGVSCIGGTLVRLRARVSVAGASTFPDSTDTITLAARSSVIPGSGVTRYYDAFYRNAAAAFCPPATFNVTNGVRIAW